MKVAIINISDRFGGASRAVYRLLKGLEMNGVDARMIVKRKGTPDPSVIPVDSRKEGTQRIEEVFERIEKRYIQENRTPLSDSAFTFPYPGFDLSSCAVLKQSDVINLHNIRGFQSVETISRLLNMGKPVVWTLHDQNAFTGGCHYSAGCDGYRNECLDCPQLRDNRYQIPFHVLKNKRKHWVRNLTVVAPSRWMARCAEESRVLGLFRVEAILNSVETEIFRPASKAKSKGVLGIDPEASVILYNALHHIKKRKGFAEFVEAIKHCLENPGFKESVEKGKIQFVTVGLTHRKPPQIPVPLFSYGKVDSDELLATIFAAADVYVLSSLEDNLPNTMLEAMACGTPVIAFDVGGMPEIIRSGINGYIVPFGDSDRMAGAILDLVCHKDLAESMGLEAAKFAQREFALNVQGRRYLQLFRTLTRVPFERGPKISHENRDMGCPNSIEFSWDRQEIDREFRRSLREVFEEEGLE